MTSLFHMITGKNESKLLTKHMSWYVNVNFKEENVIQIKSGITMNVCVSVKSIIYVKKNEFGILLHLFAKMVNIYQVLLMIY